MLGWLSPNANQAFREAFVGRPIPPGVNELTLPDVRRFAAGEWWTVLHLSPIDGTDTGRRLEAAYSFSVRLALAAAPVPMCLVAWAVAGRRTAVRTLVAILTWIAYIAAHVMSNVHPLRETIPVVLLAWWPTAVPLVVVAAMTVRNGERGVAA